MVFLDIWYQMCHAGILRLEKTLVSDSNVFSVSITKAARLDVDFKNADFPHLQDRSIWYCQFPMYIVLRYELLIQLT